MADSTQATPAQFPLPDEEDPSRRDVIMVAAGGFAAVGLGLGLWPLLDMMNPDASALSMATTEVDLSPVEEGQAITVMWRGKPIFIRHRTKKEIEEAKAAPLDDLIDPIARNANLPEDAPATDENRAGKDRETWLVMIGICTHLGCIPKGQAIGDPKEITTAGSARATARNMTARAACASDLRRRTWRSRVMPLPQIPRSRSANSRSWRIIFFLRAVNRH